MKTMIFVVGFLFILLPSLIFPNLFNDPDLKTNMVMAKDLASLLDVPSQYYTEFVSGASNFFDVLDLSEGISYLSEGNYEKAMEDFLKLGVSRIVNLIPILNTLITAVNFAKPFWDHILKAVFEEKIRSYYERYRKLKLDELFKILDEDPLKFNGSDFKRWIENDGIDVKDFIMDTFGEGGMKHGLYNIGNKRMNEVEFEKKSVWEKLKGLFIDWGGKAHTYDEVKSYWLKQWKRMVVREAMEIVLERKRQAISRFMNMSSIKFVVSIESNEDGEYVLRSPEISVEIPIKEKCEFEKSLTELPNTDSIKFVLLDERGNILTGKTVPISELFKKYDPWTSGKGYKNFIFELKLGSVFRKDTIKNLNFVLPEDAEEVEITLNSSKLVLHNPSPSLDIMKVFEKTYLYIDDVLKMVITEPTDTISVEYYIIPKGKVDIRGKKIKTPRIETEDDFKRYIMKAREEFLSNLRNYKDYLIFVERIRRAVKEYPNPTNITPQTVVGYDEVKKLNFGTKMEELENAYERIYGDLQSKVLDFKEAYFLKSFVNADPVIPAYWSMILKLKEKLISQLEERLTFLEKERVEIENLMKMTESLAILITQKRNLLILFRLYYENEVSALLRKLTTLLNHVNSTISSLQNKMIEVENLPKIFLVRRRKVLKKASEVSLVILKLGELDEERGRLLEEIKRYESDLKLPQQQRWFEMLSSMVIDGNISLHHLRKVTKVLGLENDDVEKMMKKMYELALKEGSLIQKVENYNKTIDSLENFLRENAKYHFFARINLDELKMDEDGRIVEYPEYNINVYEKYYEIYIPRRIHFTNRYFITPEAENILNRILTAEKGLFKEDAEGDRIIGVVRRLSRMVENISTLDDYNRMAEEWFKLYRSESFFSMRMTTPVGWDPKFLSWLSKRNYENQRYFLDEYVQPLSSLFDKLEEVSIEAIESYKKEMLEKIRKLPKMGKMRRRMKCSKLKMEISKSFFDRFSVKIPRGMEYIFGYFYEKHIEDHWSEVEGFLFHELSKVK